jgi:DNA-binding transcriptional ArsR family regulator
MPADDARTMGDLYRALAHPLRGRILAAAGAGTTSPVELARELDEPLGVVSYHVRVLAKTGLLEPAGTSPRRGALQHHYRATDAATVLRFTVPAGGVAALVERVRALVGDRPAAAGDRASEGSEVGEDAVEMTVLLRRTSGTEPS